MFIRAHSYFILPLYVAFKGIKMSAKPILYLNQFVDRGRSVYGK